MKSNEGEQDDGFETVRPFNADPSQESGHSKKPSKQHASIPDGSRRQRVITLIAQLAKFLTNKQAGKSVMVEVEKRVQEMAKRDPKIAMLIQEGKPMLAHEWAELFAACGLHGYPSEVQAADHLAKLLAPAVSTSMDAVANLIAEAKQSVAYFSGGLTSLGHDAEDTMLKREIEARLAKLSTAIRDVEGGA